MSKVSIRTKMSIQIELQVEYDKLAGQSVIMKANISDHNFISVRDVYESMSSGDLTKLDFDTREILKEEFLEKCLPFAGKHYSEFPMEEIRSIPMHANVWENVYRSATGVYCMIPTGALVHLMSGLCVFIEPVLSRVPTAYVWDMVRGSEEKQKVRKIINELNNPDLEESEGAIRLRWPKFG